jgi:hypothetical protein
MRHSSARRQVIRAFAGAAALMLALALADAEKWTATDFPLRVHIFIQDNHSLYYHEHLDRVDSEGRANLYENGWPRGFDFAYRCAVTLQDSMAYETYMARWKKQNQVLQVLLPEMGAKPGSMELCELRVTMKDGAYWWRNGALDEEPQPQLKDWMVKHQYDPERGLNQPVTAQPAPVKAPAAQ